MTGAPHADRQSAHTGGESGHADRDSVHADRSGDGVLDAALSPDAEALYRQIRENGGELVGPPAEVDANAALQELVARGLVAWGYEPAPGLRRYSAVHPAAAAARWREHLEETAVAHFKALETLNAQLRPLAQLYAEADRTAGRGVGGFELVHGVPNINRRISEIVAGCVDECLTLQPGKRDPAVLAQLHERDVAVAQRLSWRTLYETNEIANPALRHYVDAMRDAGSGAEFRTLPSLSRRLIILDARVAIMDAPARTPSPPASACLVTDPHVVGYLRSHFDTLWSAGEPFPGPEPRVTVPDGEHRAVASLLFEGLDVAQIARRLDVPLRRCQAIIAELKQEAGGAETLFQLGVKLAHLQD